MFTAKGGKMKALSVEQSILDGEKEIKELFKYVKTNAEGIKAYECDLFEFKRILANKNV